MCFIFVSLRLLEEFKDCKGSSFSEFEMNTQKLPRNLPKGVVYSSSQGRKSRQCSLGIIILHMQTRNSHRARNPNSKFLGWAAFLLSAFSQIAHDLQLSRYEASSI